ncbi:MAG: PfkB family carbohydrate kinase [Kiritimatiellae bacterium]|nr:PfkB family carbohydrate kinase [Kiritimatiellia bacterium]MDD4735941.1 PfkB family carbohydrate kinase [Kiritimatiellia bacterium]
MQNTACQLLVVGSIGIDTVETPAERRVEILGGSASFACVAASYFAPTAMVGVVGTDFPEAYMDLYRRSGIDLQGLQIQEGQTFRWSGVYEENMDCRTTLSTDLNVFESFSPEIPENYRDIPYLFLGNIQPALQLHVLDQIRKPEFVMVDTMDLWINIAREDLLRVIARVDLLTVNDSEARLLTGASNLRKAARELLQMGPRYVLIKKGEHGSVLFSKDSVFILPAYLLENVVDPTGAGDTFAGAFMGALAEKKATDERSLRQAMLLGNVVASFGVEGFSLDRLQALSREEITERADLLRAMMAV